jgi:hypothetical protein
MNDTDWSPANLTGPFGDVGRHRGIDWSPARHDSGIQAKVTHWHHRLPVQGHYGQLFLTKRSTADAVATLTEHFQPRQPVEHEYGG